MSLQNINELSKLLDLSEEAIKKLTIGEIEQLLTDRQIDEYKRSELLSSMFTVTSTSTVKNKVITNDEISQGLFDKTLSIPTDGSTFPITDKHGERELTARVNIFIENLPDVQISKELTAIDREIHDAVVSLYVDGGNEYITPAMIHRVLSANKNSRTSEKLEKDIIEALIKFSRTTVTIDASEEGKTYGFDEFEFSEPLLMFSRAKGLHKGKVLDWFQIVKKPMLYRYADAKGQVVRVPMDYLNTSLNKNEEIIVLQGYLLRRVTSMKHYPSLPKTILYTTIYKQMADFLNTQVSSLTRKKKQKIRESVEKILDHWKTNEFIKDFETITTKNKVAESIRISFQDD